jgi:two-component system NarL family sensor kinase
MKMVRPGSVSEALAAETALHQLERRNRELLILNTFAEALNRQIDLDNALHTALALVTDLFDLETGWIWLLHPDTQQVYVAAAQNLPPALADNPTHLEGDDCFCLEKYHLGHMDGATNVSFITCTRLKNLAEGTGGLRYHASIPLYHRERRVGVLNVARTDWQELSDEDLRILSTVGGMLSIAVERAQWFERSVQLGAAEERNRLAREIHDTLAQGLTAIALQLETADALIEMDAQRAKPFIRRALALTRTSLEDARRSVLDLRAAPLQDRTLAEALAELVEEQGRQSGLAARFDQVGGGRPLPVRCEVGLYRIAQEAINNTIRHAHAQHLAVRLVVSSDAIELTIEDDGAGFDPAALPDGEHFGLIGINERARLMGGSLALYSAVGDGTTLRVVVPLSAKGSADE